MQETVLVGVRANRVAKLHAQWVINQLSGFFNRYRFQIVEIQTRGDVYTLEPFGYTWEDRLFTREIEDALEKGDIDFAVCSMGEVEYELPGKLILGAVVGRSDPSDVLVSRDDLSLDALKPGAKIGTGSLLRKAQLLKYRTDLNIVPCSGNIVAKIEKLHSSGLDGVVLGAVGLERLGLEDKITEYLPYSVCMPPPGQGAVGIEVRRDDTQTRNILERVHNPMAAAAVLAERRMTESIGAKYSLPVGALARFKGKRLYLEAVVLSADGKASVRAFGTGFFSEAEKLGTDVAEKLVLRGAGSLANGVG